MPSALKRLATKDDACVIVECPASEEVLRQRERDYPLLSPIRFNRKHGGLLFVPIQLSMDDQTHQVQVNACDNPFCKWFGLAQHRFENAKNKPSRYKLDGSRGDNSQTVRIKCNDDPIGDPGIVVPDKYVSFSNWSLAEEIARLARNDRVYDVEPDYKFHKAGCGVQGTTPWDYRDTFKKKGKHPTSKSQRWQCRHCGKLTNVLPRQRESWTYHQQRNEIVPRFADLLVNKVPVKRTMETLNIGAQTYYDKLELLYKRCLSFLERHERRAFKEKSFRTMWMATDQMIYNLNNVRKKGQGGKHYDDLEDLQLNTHVIVSAEVSSRYVFRADVAYDWEVTPDDVEADTLLYKDDHLASYARKNDRLRFAYAPQPPTSHDSQTHDRYESEMYHFDLRRKYVDGMHINGTYTAMAQYWLIKHMVNADEWRLVSDDDSSLATALYRIFADEIRSANAHHFLCLTDREKARKIAYREYTESRKDLKAWAMGHGLDTESIYAIARMRLAEQLETHSFYNHVNKYPVHAKRPIEHPLPTIDKGYFRVDCRTDLPAYDPLELADLLMKVNDKASSEFMQQIRRRLSILERPLTTAREKDGKSYIYANFNPRYAQYAITILRTYYNFCLPWKRNQNLTPAQRIGIADRQYTMKDILYVQ